MKRLGTWIGLALVAPLAVAQAVVKPADQLKWADAGIPGVATSAVEGDMKKGASRFYLRYASGFVTPPHHHSADHTVTTVTGTLVLSAGGKEYKLAPGSYFKLTRKAPHTARCEAGADCVMFIDARSPWDVKVQQ